VGEIRVIIISEKVFAKISQNLHRNFATLCYTFNVVADLGLLML